MQARDSKKAKHLLDRMFIIGGSLRGFQGPASEALKTRDLRAQKTG
jgi:hypothetical protein